MVNGPLFTEITLLHSPYLIIVHVLFFQKNLSVPKFQVQTFESSCFLISSWGLHFSNDIFLFLPGYIHLFCQTCHWDFSLLLAFINICSIIKQVYSFKFSKWTAGNVLQVRRKYNNYVGENLGMEDSHKRLSL